MDVGWGRVEEQGGVSMANADSRIDPKYICEMGQCVAPKVSRSGIIGPELGLETLPGDQRGSS